MLSITESVSFGARKESPARTRAPVRTASASISIFGYAYKSART